MMKQSLSHQYSVAKQLAHRTSKLDLIDGTVMTSLPLPPPLKSRRKNKCMVAKSIEGKGGLPMKDEVADEDEDEDEDEGQFTVDDSFLDGEEMEDPIVLVEDYMSQNASTHERLQRKKSLATFKEKLVNEESISIISDTPMPSLTRSGSNLLQNTVQINQQSMDQLPGLDDKEGKSSIMVSSTTAATSAATASINIGESVSSIRARSNTSSITDCPNSIPQAIMQHHKNSLEEFEEVFGKIPGSDALNYCDLCEKPLYEISAIINKRKEGREVNETRYQEFVCWECIGSYELYSQEYSKTIEHKNSVDKMKHIFKNIEMKYSDRSKKRKGSDTKVDERETTSAVKKQGTKRQFSDPLLQQLRHLRVQSSNTVGNDWISLMQGKLGLKWPVPERAPSQVV